MRLLGRAIFIFTGMIVAVLAAELLLRVTGDHALKRYIYSDVSMQRGCTRLSDELGWEFIPDSNPYINSFGLKDKPYHMKKSSDTVRILAVGDSVTEMGNFMNLLEDALNKRNDGHSYEVWNCGIGGYDIVQYAKFIEVKGIGFNPNMIIVNLCLHDVRNTAFIAVRSEKSIDFHRAKYFRHIPRYKYALINNSFFERSALYRFLLSALEKYLDSNNKEDVYQTASDYITKIKNLCEENNIRVIFAVYPYLIPFSEYTKDDIEEYDSIIRVFQQTGTEYIDLHEYLPEGNRYSYRYKPDDPVHLNERGDTLVGEVLYEFMEEIIK